MVLNPKTEDRDALKTIYKHCGNNQFLQRDVKIAISNRIFKRLCNNEFIIKDGICKIARPSPDPDKSYTYHKYNYWKVNLNDGFVRKICEAD
jgi:hypothetical protein